MKQNERLSLPIDSYLDNIADIWQRHSTVIVKASPGSGKTTRLPWKLAGMSDKKVLVLEPRRLAAKLAATRIAYEEGLQLGKEIGYHFRFEKNHLPDSKLIFYTEGTFLRMLLQNSDIPDVGTIILDEFHERHIETDIALAFIRSLQTKRADLKIILMSATLDVKLQEEFPEAGLIEIEARQYNVDLHYLPNQPSVLNLPLEVKVKRCLEKVINSTGDILVFLPGLREMQKVRDHLGNQFGDVYLLHADLTKEEQNDALEFQEKRKIILATNIAESSLTIPGIEIVIDSGIQREAIYSPWTGLKTLEDRPITQSSAIQRAGRAGRLSDGKCFRLYSEQDYQNRPPFTIPEILKADLTDTYLLCSQFKQDLKWFTPPPIERWMKAQELLIKIGAIENKKLTSIGQEMLKYPLGARLSRVLFAGKEFKLSEKKKLLRYICENLEKDRYGVLEKRLASYLKGSGTDSSPWEKALLYGFIDQVSKFRKKQHDFIHYSGKTLKIHSTHRDLSDEFYLILDVTSRLEAITLIPIEEEWLYELTPFPFSEEETLVIDERFTLKRATKLGSILLEEELLHLNWSNLSENLREKVLIQGERRFQKLWERWKEEDVFQKLHYWSRLEGRSFEELETKITLRNFLLEREELCWDNINSYFQTTLEKDLGIISLEEALPSKINLSGIKSIDIHYPYGLDPFIEAPIQDFYGLKKTPSLKEGRISLTVKLLGPHKRPIQVTKDLSSFWKKTYQEMKREWQRDYPRHHWPDVPEEARPILLKRQL